MRHHTIDPTKRAADIADRLEKQRQRALSDKGESPYKDWPNPWLEDFDQVRRELGSVAEEAEERWLECLR